MILNANKIKYIKNVSSTSGNRLVYMNYVTGTPFDLEFSKQQRQQVGIGDQIVLEQQGKLTHIVEVANPTMNYNANNPAHPYTMQVKTIAIIPNGLQKSDSSISDADFTCLGGNTNLIPIDAVSKTVQDIEKKIVKMFKNNGNSI
jgi:hypothetical protein